MFKLLVTVAVIYAVYHFWIKKPQIKTQKQATQRAHEEAKQKARRSQTKKKETEEEDTMVPCEKCGTYVAVDEAIIKDGRYYCSKSCAGVK